MDDEKKYVSLWIANYKSSGVATLEEDEMYIPNFNQRHPNLRKPVMAMINNGIERMSYQLKDETIEYSLKIITK